LFSPSFGSLPEQILTEIHCAIEFDTMCFAKALLLGCCVCRECFVRLGWFGDVEDGTGLGGFEGVDVIPQTELKQSGD
jgi:hypothetical protein